MHPHRSTSFCIGSSPSHCPIICSICAQRPQHGTHGTFTWFCSRAKPLMQGMDLMNLLYIRGRKPMAHELDVAYQGSLTGPPPLPAPRLPPPSNAPGRHYGGSGQPRPIAPARSPRCRLPHPAIGGPRRKRARVPSWGCHDFGARWKGSLPIPNLHDFNLGSSTNHCPAIWAICAHRLQHRNYGSLTTWLCSGEKTDLIHISSWNHKLYTG